MRMLELDDAAELQQLVLANLAHLNAWLRPRDSYRDLAIAQKRITDNLERFASGGGFYAGVFVDGQLAGKCGVNGIDQADQCASLAYWLSTEHSGKGIMTACVAQICQYFFETVGLHRLEAHCLESNLPSRKVVERLGFRQEALLIERIRRPDGWHNEAMYGLLASEWKAKGGLPGVLGRT